MTTDDNDKQFSNDIESLRVEFSNKLNAAITKFLIEKFGDKPGSEIARDSRITIEIKLEIRDGK